MGFAKCEFCQKWDFSIWILWKLRWFFFLWIFFSLCVNKSQGFFTTHNSLRSNYPKLVFGHLVRYSNLPGIFFTWLFTIHYPTSDFADRFRTSSREWERRKIEKETMYTHVIWSIFRNSVLPILLLFCSGSCTISLIGSHTGVRSGTTQGFGAVRHWTSSLGTSFF